MLCILQIFSEVKQPGPKPGAIQGVKPQDHLPCIDPDCIKVFRKENQLIHHLSVGQHVYDNENRDTLEDRSKRLWTVQCNELRYDHQSLSTVSVYCNQASNFCENNGYALKRRKKTSRFSEKLKNYLAALFRNGEETGKKPNPYTVSRQMRSETDEEGNRLFSPSEWLSPQQIRSFFGNLCMKKQRIPKALKAEESEENDEDLQNIISNLAALERCQVIANIVSDLNH
jgi:hypothetical protein